MEALNRAIQQEDSNECVRLAHYSKGACANVGARSSAALLQQIERRATQKDFVECGASLRSLAAEIDKLKAQAGVL
jgi:HPt (histidine-containing phosphotransfer) domain-containing protein